VFCPYCKAGTINVSAIYERLWGQKVLILKYMLFWSLALVLLGFCVFIAHFFYGRLKGIKVNAILLASIAFGLFILTVYIGYKIYKHIGS
jgi:hypothetical protein